VSAPLHFETIFIGGQWCPPSGPETIEVRSPADGRIVGTAPLAGELDVERSVAAARGALAPGHPWAEASAAQRADILDRGSALISERVEELVDVIVAEVGTARRDAYPGQVVAAAATLGAAARSVRAFPFEELIAEPGRPTRVVHEPAGTVAAIVPWNVPLTIAAGKLGCALGAGCSVILKCPPEAPLALNLMASIFTDAGLPPGALSVLTATAEVSEALVRHPGVDTVSFTGSTAVGRRVAALCGEQLKRVNLELGGKSAAIVLDDVDADELVAGLLPTVFRFSGQACVAQSRILVPQARSAELVEAIAEGSRRLEVGDPNDPDTDIGPLISEQQRDRVEDRIRSAITDGARVAAGGSRPAGLDAGWYVEPTVLADAERSARIAREEVFGPVAVVLAYTDLDDAVALANDSDYGLSGSVWTGDRQRSDDIARRVRTGTFMVNGAPRALTAPFGGCKSSGIGRELGSEGIRQFTEIKTISSPWLGEQA
jgi:aldehyde dehydrogenase (NAD+)